MQKITRSVSYCCLWNWSAWTKCEKDKSPRAQYFKTSAQWRICVCCFATCASSAALAGNGGIEKHLFIRKQIEQKLKLFRTTITIIMNKRNQPYHTSEAHSLDCAFDIVFGAQRNQHTFAHLFCRRKPNENSRHRERKKSLLFLTLSKAYVSCSLLSICFISGFSWTVCGNVN